MVPHYVIRESDLFEPTEYDDDEAVAVAIRMARLPEDECVTVVIAELKDKEDKLEEDMKDRKSQAVDIGPTDEHHGIKPVTGE